MKDKKLDVNRVPHIDHSSWLNYLPLLLMFSYNNHSP